MTSTGVDIICWCNPVAARPKSLYLGRVVPTRVQSRAGNGIINRAIRFYVFSDAMAHIAKLGALTEELVALLTSTSPNVSAIIYLLRSSANTLKI